MDIFVLFCGTSYYASGGIHDFKDSSGDIDALIKYAHGLLDCDSQQYDHYVDWWHIVDIRTFEIIVGSENQGYGAPDLEGAQISV